MSRPPEPPAREPAHLEETAPRTDGIEVVQVGVRATAAGGARTTHDGDANLPEDLTHPTVPTPGNGSGSADDDDDDANLPDNRTHPTVPTPGSGSGSGAGDGDDDDDDDANLPDNRTHPTVPTPGSGSGSGNGDDGDDGGGDDDANLPDNRTHPTAPTPPTSDRGEERETGSGSAVERVRGWAASAVGHMRHPGPPEVAGRSAEEIEGSLLTRLVSPISGSKLWGWLGPLLVTVFAGVLRVVHLDRPPRLVFDETYYVKQAYSLLVLGYEGEWNEEPNERFAAGDFSDLNPTADYVVHPSVGKWMIAIGMRLVGADNPVGWRISAALIGTLSVWMLARIARRMFGSTLLGCVAGLFLAIDGVHLVMSRISILDIFVQFWILAGFGALLLDREHYRRRLAHRAGIELAEHGKYRDPWGPKVGMRWWLVAGGVALGLATGVKWSGLYALAAFGLFAVAWTITARRLAGVRLWIGAGILRDGFPAFLALVPVAALTYVLTWLPWWLNPNSYKRNWASEDNALAAVPQRTWMPDWLNSWWEYHLTMWHFHNNLDSEHTYAADAPSWIIQLRPTSFAWRTLEDAAALDACGADKCAQAITSVGNPIIWWGAALALLLVVWAALVRRDWRAWAIVAGYAAAYLPWFAYSHRTIFQFYSVAFVPFVALALTFVIGELLGPKDLPLRDRRPGIWTACVIVVAALAMSAFYWPVWTNQTVPYWFWHLHMLLPSWV